MALDGRLRVALAFPGSSITAPNAPPGTSNAAVRVEKQPRPQAQSRGGGGVEQSRPPRLNPLRRAVQRPRRPQTSPVPLPKPRPPKGSGAGARPPAPRRVQGRTETY